MTEKVESIPLAKLTESPRNIRKRFGSLTELAQSIQSQGIIEPIIARRTKDGTLEINNGHRRFRAAKEAGLKTVPVIVREMDDEAALAQMIIENKQREDVDPMELAGGYQGLLDMGLSGDEAAKRVGVSRASIYGYTSLLRMPEPIRMAVQQGKLPVDGARAIASADGERLQLAYFTEAMKLTKPGEHGPSGRAVVKLVQSKRLTSKKGQTKHQREAKAHGADVALRRRVIERLRVRVAELVERRAHLDDNDLRMLAMADVETGPDVVREVFQRRGAHPDRLGKVAGAQLRSLPVEIAVAKLATLEDGEFSSGAKAVARAYGLSLAEMEKTTANIEAAEGLFRKE